MFNIGLSSPTAASKHQNTILDKSLVCCSLLVFCVIKCWLHCVAESSFPVQWWLSVSSPDWFQAPACERPLWLEDMFNIGLSSQTAASKHQGTILDKSLVCCLLLVFCYLSVGCIVLGGLVRSLIMAARLKSRLVPGSGLRKATLA